MTDVAGVSTLKNEEGKVTHITFEVDKHKEFLQPILKDLGVIEKTRFRQNFENAMTAEEVRASVYKQLTSYSMPKKKVRFNSYIYNNKKYCNEANGRPTR